MTRTHLDYETASAVDLIGSGLHAYARDKTTRVLTAGGFSHRRSLFC